MRGDFEGRDELTIPPGKNYRSHRPTVTNTIEITQARAKKKDLLVFSRNVGNTKHLRNSSPSNRIVSLSK